MHINRRLNGIIFGSNSAFDYFYPFLLKAVLGKISLKHWPQTVTQFSLDPCMSTKVAQMSIWLLLR